MSVKASRSEKLFNYINSLVLVMLALTCILPFIHMISVSLSSNAPVLAGKVTLWPIKFTTAAYKYILYGGPFWRAFSISIGIALHQHGHTGRGDLTGNNFKAFAVRTEAGSHFGVLLGSRFRERPQTEQDHSWENTPFTGGTGEGFHRL